MKPIAKFFERAWLIALLLLIWEGMSWTRILDPLFFPPPSKLVYVFASMAASGEAGAAIGKTLSRTVIGFAAGVAAGAFLCLLAYLWKPLETALQPLIAGLYTSPRLTLLPMAMLLFGINDASRIVLIAISTALIVMMQLSDALRQVNQSFIDLAVNYGAGRAMLIRKVYMPACLPQIFTALRMSFGRALVLTISVELLSCQDGLGSMIWSSWQTFATGKLYVGIGIAAALGLVCEACFRMVERRLTPWQEKSA